MKRSSEKPVVSWLFKLAANYWKKMVLATLLGTTTIISNIGLMSVSAFLIARAAQRPSIADLQVAIVGVRFFGIARGLFRYLERLVSHDTNLRLLAGIRVWFYKKIEPLAPARLYQYRSGDLLGRIMTDIETLENFYVRVIAPPLVAILIGGLVSLWFANYLPVLGYISMISFFVSGVVLSYVSHQLGKPVGLRLVKTRAELNTVLVDGIRGMPEWLAFGKEDRLRRSIQRLGQTLLGLEGRMSGISGWQEATAGLLQDATVLGVLILAIPLVHTQQMDGIFLPVLVMGVISSFEAVLPLPVAFQYLGKSLAAGRRLFEIVNTKPAVIDPSTPLFIQTGKEIDLCIDHLYFSYTSSETMALEDISLQIFQGHRTAIVGHSGAGKTTLVNVLLRFWDYQQGSIRLGGVELRELPQQEVWRKIGVVTQRPHLFNGTILDNLLYARPEATLNEIEQAVKIAGAEKFISSLPDGYDTWIGEGGLLCSGGEQQRLALARTLLKEPDLIILDEPVANLDAITATKMMQNLDQSKSAMLIITHRLVGLENFDEIIVLQEGKILERGTHQELIKKESEYFKMWRQQYFMAGLDTYAEMWYK